MIILPANLYPTIDPIQVVFNLGVIGFGSFKVWTMKADEKKLKEQMR